MSFKKDPVLFFVLFSWSIASAALAPYKKTGEIKIGGDGGWDYVTMDDATHRLYMSQATRVVVVDTQNDQIVGEIKDTQGVHGIAIAADLGRAFSSDGKEGKVALIDLKTLQITAKTAVGENPDAIVYDPKLKKVFVFNGKSKSMSVLDAASGKVLTTLPLPGKPEFSAVDPDAGRVYVNIEDRSEILSIDTSSYKILSMWKLAPCEEPTGLAIDIVGKKLFSVCGNEKMITVNVGTGKVSSTLAIGSGADAVVYEPSTKTVFASAGQGKVTIAHADPEGNLTLIQDLATEPGARTLALDSLSHKIYLPSAQFEGKKSEGHRPKVISGTIKLLVFTPAKE
jgi:DNA-binding beta-propeller fold protein YncE